MGISVVIGILIVIAESQNIGDFQREICWTPTASWHHHGGGQGTQTLSEERIKNLTSQVYHLEVRTEELVLNLARQFSYERMLIMASLLIVGGSSMFLLYRWLVIGQGKKLGIKLMLYKSLRPVDQDRLGESENGNISVSSSSSNCLVCKGKHFNLVQCSKLRYYVPYDGTAEKLPECVCLKCLGTVNMDGSQCNHNSKAWRQGICRVSDVCYIICKTCPEHKVLQGWWKTRHDPVDGFKGYAYLKNHFTRAVVQAGIHGGTIPIITGHRRQQAQNGFQNLYRC